VATYPAAGAGLDCTRQSPPDCGVPGNAQIELRFNRFLNPATAVRQSLTVYTASPDLWTGGLSPRYDLIERVVVFSLPAGASWLSGVRYKLELRQPQADGDYGFRAFDGAPVHPSGSDGLEVSFRIQTGSVEPSTDEPGPPDCVGVEQALDVLARSGCQSAICHQSVRSEQCPRGYAQAGPGQPCVGVPRMGLDLSSIDGLVHTAVGHVAHQTETGPTSGLALENPDRFGVQMPIIDPGRPGNSYLMYKLIRSQTFWSRAPCASKHAVALPGGCIAPPRAELERLGDWFVLGEAMPPTAGEALERADLELLHSWIAQGASTQSCP
jgi:hypothetical protein